MELRSAEENVDRIALKSYSTQLKKQHEELVNLDKNILEFAPKNEEDGSTYKGKIKEALIFAEGKIEESEDVGSVRS